MDLAFLFWELQRLLIPRCMHFISSHFSAFQSPLNIRFSYLGLAWGGADCFDDRDTLMSSVVRTDSRRKHSHQLPLRNGLSPSILLCRHLDCCQDKHPIWPMSSCREKGTPSLYTKFYYFYGCYKPFFKSKRKINEKKHRDHPRPIYFCNCF